MNSPVSPSPIHSRLLTCGQCWNLEGKVEKNESMPVPFITIFHFNRNIINSSHMQTWVTQNDMVMRDSPLQTCRQNVEHFPNPSMVAKQIDRYEMGEQNQISNTTSMATQQIPNVPSFKGPRPWGAVLVLTIATCWCLHRTGHNRQIHPWVNRSMPLRCHITSSH